MAVQSVPRGGSMSQAMPHLPLLPLPWMGTPGLATPTSFPRSAPDLEFPALVPSQIWNHRIKTSASPSFVPPRHTGGQHSATKPVPPTDSVLRLSSPQTGAKTLLKGEVILSLLFLMPSWYLKCFSSPLGHP